MTKHIIKVWSEWDLGMPKYFATKEAAIKRLNSLDMEAMGFTESWKELFDEGYIGFEEETVHD